MFSTLLYLSLPLVFLLHEVEKSISRRKWAAKKYDRIVAKFPSTKEIMDIFRNMSDRNLMIIVIEETIVLCIAVILAIYGGLNMNTPYAYPLIALTWGFGIHLIFHLLQSAFLTIYTPGMFTSVVLMPYFFLTAADMSVQFSLTENLIFAFVGCFILSINSGFMNLLLKSK